MHYPISLLDIILFYEVINSDSFIIFKFEVGVVSVVYRYCCQKNAALNFVYSREN